MVEPAPEDALQPRREQYVAHDTRTGLEVAVTGHFPEDPDDRVRIARTTTLFTRLMSTILEMDSLTQRREGFRTIAIGTDLVSLGLQRHAQGSRDVSLVVDEGDRALLIHDLDPRRHLQN